MRLTLHIKRIALARSGSVCHPSVVDVVLLPALDASRALPTVLSW